MLALAFALTILFEIAIQFSRLHDKRHDHQLAAASAALRDSTATPIAAPAAIRPPRLFTEPAQQNSTATVAERSDPI